MNRALARFSVRYLIRHPWQVGLAVLGVALGVAVVAAVDLANASAQRAFDISLSTVSGPANYRIVGAPGGLDEAVYVDLRLHDGVQRAAPVVEGYAQLGDTTVRMVGIDPFASPLLNRFAGSPSLPPALLTQPGAVLMAAPAMQRHGYKVGESITVRIAGIERRLTVVGTLPPGTRLAGSEQLLVSDIATAQELFQRMGRLSWIDLVLSDAQAQRLRAGLPAGVRLEPIGTRSAVMAAMTRSFTVNLTALSLLAMVIGAFLIYNTITFSVVQRRALLGSLRALGATRGQIFALIMGEAAAIGIVGTLFGIALGLGLAHELVKLVTRTINDLYFVLTVREFFVTPATLWKSGALGLGASLIAAAAPATEAARAAPAVVMTRSALERRVRHLVPWLTMGGLIVVAAGIGVVGLARTLVTGYVGLFTVILGCAMLSPAVTLLLLAPIRRLLARRTGLLGALAARGVTAALSRTSTAIAALMVAIAATVGIGVMVASFRSTVEHWLEYHLRADLYVSVPTAFTGRTSTPLEPSLVAALTADPAVKAYTTWRGVEVGSAYGPTHLSVVTTSTASRRGYRLVRGEARTAWRAFADGAVLVSESYARRHGLRSGARLALTTERGQHSFPVAGVFYDYGSDWGIVLMARRVYERDWSDPVVSALGLYLRAGTDPEAVAGRLRRIAAGHQQVLIRSNRALREASMAIFDRTFTITRVLRLLAMAVAFVAVVSALMAIQLERAREFAILRASGLTPGQLWRLMLTQTGLMGLVAGMLAAPVGLALAYILTRVINRLAFGWTLEWHVYPAAASDVLLLGVGAAVLAGLYPAWRMARTPPALALREE